MEPVQQQVDFVKWYHRIMDLAPLLSIIVVNLWILINVILGRADLYNIIILYWLETAVIGFFNLLKMACLGGKQAGVGEKAKYMLFFTVHYFGFVIGQGVFITVTMLDLYKPEAATRSNFLLMLLILFLSHLLEFCFNYLKKGEFRSATLNRLLFRPYGRIITQQIVILAGGYFLFHSHLSKRDALVAILVLMKIITEMGGYYWDRRSGGAIKQPAD